MCRSLSFTLVVFVLMLGTRVGGAALAGQEPSSADFFDHPLVGAWFVDIRPEDPESPPELAMISPHGLVVITAAGGLSGVGAWKPTDDSTATVTFSVWLPDGNRLLVRASAEVAPDGLTFTGPYTNEFFNPAGEGTGEIGSGVAEATRMEVQGPGATVTSFEELSDAAEGTSATKPES